MLISQISHFLHDYTTGPIAPPRNLFQSPEHDLKGPLPIRRFLTDLHGILFVMTSPKNVNGLATLQGASSRLGPGLG